MENVIVYYVCINFREYRMCQDQDTSLWYEVAGSPLGYKNPMELLKILMKLY